MSEETQPEAFDAKSARTRQPLPLWAGAFDRATKEQTAEVIGAYMLLLMAMWESKSCDLPSDDRHLAWVAKVSPTIWRRRLAPIIMPMRSEENSRISSEKLTENARKTEEYCRKQYERKARKFQPKPLKNNNTASTTDKPTDQTTAEPKPLTINHIDDDSARARKSSNPISLKERLLTAMRLDQADVAAVCDATGMQIVRRWITELGLTPDEVVEASPRTQPQTRMAGRSDRGPPSQRNKAGTVRPHNAPRLERDREPGRRIRPATSRVRGETWPWIHQVSAFSGKQSSIRRSAMQEGQTFRTWAK